MALQLTPGQVYCVENLYEDIANNGLVKIVSIREFVPDFDGINASFVIFHTMQEVFDFIYASYMKRYNHVLSYNPYKNNVEEMFEYVGNEFETGGLIMVWEGDDHPIYYNGYGMSIDDFKWLHQQMKTTLRDQRIRLNEGRFKEGEEDDDYEYQKYADEPLIDLPEHIRERFTALWHNQRNENQSVIKKE